MIREYTLCGKTFHFYNAIEDDGNGGEKITFCDSFGREFTRKVYFRFEKTWDDHIGNTPCGHYINLSARKFDNRTNKYKTVHKLVYLFP